MYLQVSFPITFQDFLSTSYSEINKIENFKMKYYNIFMQKTYVESRKENISTL